MEDDARICPSCGTQNGGVARFCMACGTPLTAVERPPGPPAGREVERKVITALFCDVVGSTELAEALDPEDVDRLLRTYHGLARRRIEHHGGVVEKFIGDAVVGIFGVPIAHEDDPRRAVVAALEIIDEIAASELGLHVRIGLHTGEALVRVGTDRTPEEGFATGDTLNTAARLQGVAPVDGVAVGDPTYRLTTEPFEWEDLGPAALKGKAKPIQVWRPVRARHHAAAEARVETTPFLGRDAELRALVAAFERAALGTTQLVTILAEPGMGKSRLVRELAHRVADADDAVTWRTGRCLPYGDGVSFWALGEIVKSHAGILETDDQATIGARLDAVLTEPDPSLRAWMRDRLAPLVGLRTDAAPASYAESFAAWRRFLVSLDAGGPVVVVIEDLHWADTAFVDFLLSFVVQEPQRRLLLVVTARPEVAERHPAWLDRARQASVIQLTALGDDSIVVLVEQTLAGAPPELVATVLERAGGSPLYAEQLAAMVRERSAAGDELTFDETAIPSTVQALLAARIDALPGAQKATVLDASVVGRTFWSGAVSSLAGRERASVETLLVDLAHRELTRSQVPSSMAGEAEYGFWHALLRDVAYSFLPRSARLAKHRAAAAWITRQAGGMPGDLAEIVVDHHRRALDLAEAIGDADDLPAIRTDLGSSLLVASSNALRIDPDRAMAFVLEALGLLEADDPRRPEALVTLGRAQLAVSDFPEAVRTLDTARDWYLAHDDAFAAAGLAVHLAYGLNRIGEYDRTQALIADARPILEARPGPELVELEARQAMEMLRPGDDRASVAQADKAMALAARYGLPPPPRALFARGIARLQLDDLGGAADMRRGIQVASDLGDVHLVQYGYANLGDALIDVTTPPEALAVFDEGISYCAARGVSDAGLRANRLDALVIAGRWDDLLDEGPALRAEGEARGDAWMVFLVDMLMESVRLDRGEVVGRLDHLGDQAATVNFPPAGAMSTAAAAAMAMGEPEEARRLLTTGLDLTPEGDTVFGALDQVLTCIELGDLVLARRVLSKAVPAGPSSRGQLTRQAEAFLAEAEGDVATALEKFTLATAYFQAHDWRHDIARGLVGKGRCLIASGRTDEGRDALLEARRVADGLPAPRVLRQVDEALAAMEARG